MRATAIVRTKSSGSSVLRGCQGRPFHAHQHVDRHAFRMHRQAGKRRNHADAVFRALTHPDNPAAANVNSRVAHVLERIEPVLVCARGDDLAVIFRRCIEIVVVIVEAAVLQPPRLIAGQHAERDAGLHPERLHALDHRADFVEIAIFGRAPRRAHAEARRAASFCRTRLVEHGIKIHQLLGFDAGVEFRRLRAIGAIFRAAAGLDRQQCRDLDLGGVEVFAMNLRRTKNQFRERKREQVSHLFVGPVVSRQTGYWEWRRVMRQRHS